MVTGALQNSSTPLGNQEFLCDVSHTGILGLLCMSWPNPLGSDYFRPAVPPVITLSRPIPDSPFQCISVALFMRRLRGCAWVYGERGRSHAACADRCGCAGSDPARNRNRWTIQVAEPPRRGRDHDPDAGDPRAAGAGGRRGPLAEPAGDSRLPGSGLRRRRSRPALRKRGEPAAPRRFGRHSAEDRGQGEEHRRQAAQGFALRWRSRARCRTSRPRTG